LLLAYLALRFALLTTAGYPPDIGQFKLWALQAEQDGLAALYGGGADHDFSRFDYPPFYAYVLRTLGWLYSFVEPDALRRQADSTLLTALVKLPALLADLAVALLLAAIARRSAAGTEPKVARGAAVAVAAAWLLDPAVLLDGGHWGQPDSIHSGFVLAAFATIGGALGPARGTRRNAALAWSWLALAALMKPLGAPFFPLLLAITLLTSGVAAAACGALAAAAVAVALFAPFVAEWGVATMVERLLGDVTIMAYTSVNGHNLWWLFGPWRDAESPLVGPLTPTHLGLLAFAVAMVAVIVLAVRRHRGRHAGLHAAQVLALAAFLATAFFLVSTHLHENHLYGALPLLLGAIAAAPPQNSTRPLAWLLFAALSLGVAWNVAAHDFVWRQCWPFILGADAPFVGDAPDQRLPRGEWLAGTIGTWWNLACGAALATFCCGASLQRLPWRRETTPPPPGDAGRGRP